MKIDLPSPLQSSMAEEEDKNFAFLTSLAAHVASASSIEEGNRAGIEREDDSQKDGRDFRFIPTLVSHFVDYEGHGEEPAQIEPVDDDKQEADEQEEAHWQTHLKEMRQDDKEDDQRRDPVFISSLVAHMATPVVSHEVKPQPEAILENPATIWRQHLEEIDDGNDPREPQFISSLVAHRVAGLEEEPQGGVDKVEVHDENPEQIGQESHSESPTYEEKAVEAVEDVEDVVHKGSTGTTLEEEDERQSGHEFIASLVAHSVCGHQQKVPSHYEGSGLESDAGEAKEEVSVETTFASSEAPSIDEASRPHERKVDDDEVTSDGALASNGIPQEGVFHPPEAVILEADSALKAGEDGLDQEPQECFQPPEAVVLDEDAVNEALEAGRLMEDEQLEQALNEEASSQPVEESVEVLQDILKEDAADLEEEPTVICEDDDHTEPASMEEQRYDAIHPVAESTEVQEQREEVAQTQATGDEGPEPEREQKEDAESEAFSSQPAEESTAAQERSEDEHEPREADESAAGIDNIPEPEREEANNEEIPRQEANDAIGTLLENGEPEKVKSEVVNVEVKCDLQAAAPDVEGKREPVAGEVKEEGAFADAIDEVQGKMENLERDIVDLSEAVSASKGEADVLLAQGVEAMKEAAVHLEENFAVESHSGPAFTANTEEILNRLGNVVNGHDSSDPAVLDVTSETVAVPSVTAFAPSAITEQPKPSNPDPPYAVSRKVVTSEPIAPPRSKSPPQTPPRRKSPKTRPKREQNSQAETSLPPQTPPRSKSPKRRARKEDQQPPENHYEEIKPPVNSAKPARNDSIPEGSNSRAPKPPPRQHQEQNRQNEGQRDGSVLEYIFGPCLPCFR